MLSTEGNTLTGFINLLRSPIHPDRIVHRLFCIAMLALASASSVLAQAEPKRPEPAPATQVANPQPADPPAAPSTPATVRLQFPNSDVVDVLHLYEQLTGKKLVMDNFVQGKVNIFIAKDVSRDEAIKIIEMSMALNGISLVPAGRDLIEIVGAGQNPRKAPVPIISDLADIPAGNPVVSFLFKLQYADPQELQQVLMAYFQGSSGPINMPFIRQLIHEFDANVEFAKPVTRYLKYVSAGEVLPVLVQALTEPGTEGGGPGAGGGGGLIPGASPGQGQAQARKANYTGGTSSLTGSESTGTAGGGTLNISEELSTQPVDTTPKAVTIGNSKLIADQRANSIIVLGNREVVVKVEKILDEMDVKAPQVALSTVIGQLTLSNNEEFGVDWFAKYQNKLVGISRNNSIFGNNDPRIPVPASSVSPAPVIGNGSIIDPSNLINFGQIIQNVANGTNVYVAAGNYLAAIVHLLEGTGKFKVMSRPTVFTSNNKKAIIASGQEVPVPVSTLTNAGTIVNQAAVAASVEYKNVVLQLEVVPLINSEKEVSLDILQKLDSLVPNGNVIISGNSVPTIDTKYIRTNVSAPNGSTIVLGGLIEDQKQKQYQGIPYLSRIPLIGAAFRATSSGKERRELIILMCPQVTLTKLDAYRLRQKWEDTTHFGPELDQNECQDCPNVEGGKQLALPPPDIPAAKDM